MGVGAGPDGREARGSLGTRGERAKSLPEDAASAPPGGVPETAVPRWQTSGRTAV